MVPWCRDTDALQGQIQHDDRHGEPAGISFQSEGPQAFERKSIIDPRSYTKRRLPSGARFWPKVALGPGHLVILMTGIDLFRPFEWYSLSGSYRPEAAIRAQEASELHF